MFSDKYPGFTALLALVGNAVKEMEIPNESILQKLEGSVVLVPQIIQFIPLASLLAPELAALKVVPADIEAGAEMLVADLAFSSDKAKSIIAAAFPLAENLVGIIPNVSALVAAIKA